MACPTSHSTLNQRRKSEIPVLYPWNLPANLKILTPLLCLRFQANQKQKPSLLQVTVVFCCWQGNSNF